jgi:hypothetical protein
MLYSHLGQWRRWPQHRGVPCDIIKHGAMLAMLFLLSVSCRLKAQDSLPSVVSVGLRLVENGRPDSALATWAASRAFGTSEREAIVTSIPLFQQTCGTSHGYDLVRRIDLGRHLRRLYLIVRCSLRPIYLLMVIYNAGAEDWFVTTLNWNTDYDRVFPSAFLGSERP